MDRKPNTSNNHDPWILLLVFRLSLLYSYKHVNFGDTWLNLQTGHVVPSALTSFHFVDVWVCFIILPLKESNFSFFQTSWECTFSFSLRHTLSLPIWFLWHIFYYTWHYVWPLSLFGLDGACQVASLVVFNFFDEKCINSVTVSYICYAL